VYVPVEAMKPTAVEGRILAVDDDPSIRALLEHELSDEGFDVRTAASGDEALRLARTELPDLVILDIMMQGLDGISVCRRLRERDPDLAILLLTARHAVDDELAAFAAGADDYVRKPFSLDILAARIRSLLRRHGHPTQHVVRYADLAIDVRGRTVQRGARPVKLTATEFDLLELLAHHAGQVLTKEQILEQLWDYDFGGNANVVEVYVHSLRQKLEACGEPRLIQTVRGAGYVLRE